MESTTDIVFRKLLDIQSPERNFSCIFDFGTMTYIWISDSFKNVLGYEKSDLTVEFYLNNIHPDDRAWVLSVERKIKRFFEEFGADGLAQFKILYDYRFKNKFGTYVRLLNQMIQTGDLNSGLSKRYGVITDISLIKKNGDPTFNLIGLNKNCDSLIDISLEKKPNKRNPFSKREKEIISFIAQGYTSKEIADKLFISLDTVKNHKKNIFKKADCNSSIQLIKQCVLSGWLEVYNEIIKTSK